MCHWCFVSWRFSHNARKPAVRVLVCTHYFAISELIYSWLIDNDKDAEGLRVLIDLHGGDPEDMTAKEEFQEIKDRVMAEVRSLVDRMQGIYSSFPSTARVWRS